MIYNDVVMKMTDSESVNRKRKEIKENEDQKSRRERYSEDHGIVGTGIGDTCRYTS